MEATALTTTTAEPRNSLDLLDRYTQTHRTEDLIEAFKRQFTGRTTTGRTYAGGLRLFFDWVATTGRSIDRLAIDDIIAFKAESIAQGCSASTTNSRLTALRAFYQWAEANKFYPNIAAGVKGMQTAGAAEYVRRPLSGEEASKLLRTAQRRMTKRDFAIVNLILRTGLRDIEVSRALVSDIRQREGKRVLYVQGKGRDTKEEFVILSPAAYAPIEAYLRTRTRRNNEPLFVGNGNRNRGALSTHAISQICRRALDAIHKTGREYTAHSLRHTAATLLIDAGATIEQVQGVLRHRNPATTQRYTTEGRIRARLRDNVEARLDDLIKAPRKAATKPAAKKAKKTRVNA